MQRATNHEPWTDKLPKSHNNITQPPGYGFLRAISTKAELRRLALTDLARSHHGGLVPLGVRVVIGFVLSGMLNRRQPPADLQVGHAAEVLSRRKSRRQRIWVLVHAVTFRAVNG